MLRVGNDGDPLDVGQHFLEQLHSLAHNRQCEKADSGQISSWPSEALNELGLDRVGTDAKYDRRLHACANHRSQCRTALCQDDVGARANNVACQLLDAFFRSLAPPCIDHEVAALDVPQLAHARSERFKCQ